MIHEHLIDNTVYELQDHEGFKDKPYQDTRGVWTFGHGLTYITKQESLMIMRHRIKVEYLPQLRCLIPFFDKLTPNRQEVLLNMTYNLGIGGLAGFKKMITALVDGDYAKASKEMLDSNWSRQVGQRSKDLAERMERG